jgi:signal transduction histidine kinase
MKDNLKVLIVDDNTDNLEMLEIILKSNNYTVSSAINGKVALELLHAESYDLIISDILMPVMDGFQLCRECKKDESLRNICFVFYTATYIDSKDEEFALSLGAQKFIRKPQEPETFLKIITKVVADYNESENRNVVYNETNEKEILKLYSERLVAKLEKKNLDLEKEIASHNKTLKELIKAKEKAEESDKLKTAFLSNMSHEIRTPMNGIIGFSNLLKNPRLSADEQNKYIDIIQLSGTRLINLIEDLINISQIETGQVSICTSEFKVQEALEQIVSYFKTDAENKNLSLSLNCLPSLKEENIITDKGKFEAIFINLLKNAIKYTKKGEIELGCKKANSIFEFYIKDTGLGIPKDRQEAIFERFVQADINDTLALQGAGLGLSITKAFVELLLGNIRVESEERKGTIFYLTIPSMKDNNEKEIDDLSEYNQANDLNSNKNLKILIAEDDKTSDEYLTVILQDLSKNILHAKNGREAIEKCKTNKEIDLILMDIKMPDIDGYKAVEQIREFNKEVIIIAQTAYGISNEKERAIHIGCNDYISKPIDENRLISLIEKHLKLKMEKSE